MAESGENEIHDGAHVVGVPVLVGVFLALMVLTVITVAATLINLQGLNLLIAMGIATVKGSLVVLYFMHLRYDSPFNAVVFVTGLVFMWLFLAVTLMDSVQYQSQVAESRWSENSPPADPGNAFAAMMGGKSGEELFTTFCISCHRTDTDATAPKLQEIYELHRGKPEGIVTWAMNPQRKRKEKYATPMPSMAYVGEQNLAKVADFMLRVGSGEEELVIDDSQWIRNLEPAEVTQVAIDTPGDPTAGSGLFISQTCVTCHVAEEGQRSVGPPLAGIGKRMDRAQIVKAILDPSDTITKGYETVTIYTMEGRIHTGLILNRDESTGAVTLRLTDSKIIEIPDDDVDEIEKVDLSQMPNGLVDNITPTQLAHLAAYLESL